MISSRVLPLRTTHNFRDMGGYRAGDGRSVRWGVLFRSGVMAATDEHDRALLRALDIKTICDFRTTDERHRRPTTWHDDTTDLVTQEYHVSGGVLHQLIRRKGVTAAQIEAIMIDVYRELPFEQAGNYRNLFRQVVTRQVPLVFNCSAGKDRTGVAAALVLFALGVARQEIEADYLLTNDVMPALQRILAGEPDFARLMNDADDITRPLLRAELVYLQAALDTITQRHGSIEQYLHDVIGLCARDLATIRDVLLE